MCHLYRPRIKTHVLTQQPCFVLSRDKKVYRKHMQGAGTGTQTCSGSGGQPSEFDGPGQPTDRYKGDECYDEANRGY